MEFIQENYLWFIIGGIVILMAVIGYIADKTNFGRNKIEKAPKEPKQPKEKKQEKIEIDAKGIGELTQSLAEETSANAAVIEPSNAEEIVEPTVPANNVDSVVEPTEVPVENVEPVIETAEDIPFTVSTDEASLYEPLQGSTVEINSPITDDLTTPVEPVVEPFAVPVAETITDGIAPVEDLTAPLVEEKPEDLTAPLVAETVPVETTEEQPVVIDNSEVVSDDDIWKF